MLIGMASVASDDCIKMLKALADPSRWRIVQSLLAAPLTVTELTLRLGLTQYNTSKHLRILREAGIIQTEKEGRLLICSVVPAFRQKLARSKNQLDLGCCTFRFD